MIRYAEALRIEAKREENRRYTLTDASIPNSSLVFTNKTVRLGFTTGKSTVSRLCEHYGNIPINTG